MEILGGNSYRGLDLNACHLLKRRYLNKDGNDCPTESPTDLFERVAGVMAGPEIAGRDITAKDHWHQRFFNAMQSLEFLPNSTILLNAGRFSRQLAACVALPLPNSLALALDVLQQTMDIHLRGAGTAFCLSSVPASDGNASAVPVIKLLHEFSDALQTVRQGGIRCGCNTACLSVHHPDIMYFIRAKNRPDVLNNFYLSVDISREFMQALENGSSYPLYVLGSRQQYGTASAEKIFGAIVESSWNNGDPGVVFEESIEQSNPVPHLGKIEMVSGCGEQLMLPLEACFLGSINVARMLVTEGDGSQRMDWGRLKYTVETGVRLLDNAIDVSTYPGQKIQYQTSKSRKVGLGIMGLASLFYRLAIPYDSQDAMDMAEQIMKTVRHAAYRASAEIAEEKGPYPAWRDETRDGMQRRNASLTTIAPTGTLSILAGCSAGIEPVYRLAYIRRIFNSPPLLEIDPEFVSAARREGIFSKELIKSLVDGQRLKQIKGIPEWMKRVFVTSMDIHPDMHLKMQAAVQKYTDNAVSKTVNLPARASRHAIAKIYTDAYRMGLKGVTVYRDCSRPNQPLDICSVGNDLLEKWFSMQSNPDELLYGNHRKYR